MEARFATDFSSVRVHTDSTAADLSRSLAARAFSVGRDLFFGQNQHQPQSENGRHLIAHELAHVNQAGVTGDDVIRRVMAPATVNDSARESEDEPLSDIEKAYAVFAHTTAVGGFGRFPAVQRIMEAEPYWHLLKPDDAVLGLDPSYPSGASMRDDGATLDADEVRRMNEIYAKTHGRAAASKFFGLFDYNDIVVTMTDPVGVSIFWYMASYLDGQLAQHTRELLEQFYGALSSEPMDKITAQNYPSGKVRGTLSGRTTDRKNYRNWCVDAVLGNMENASNTTKVAEIKNLSSEKRQRDIIAPLERELDGIRSRTQRKERQGKDVTQDKNDLDAKKEEMEWKKKPLTSQYANAAVDLGYTVPVGECKIVRSVCQKAIVHDGDGSDDPFSFTKRGNSPKIIDEFFSPNPVTMMLDAIAGAPAGQYMFPTAVSKHHSATLLVKKLKGGPISQPRGPLEL